MKNMTLWNIARACGGRLIVPAGKGTACPGAGIGTIRRYSGKEAAGIVLDSRKVSPGFVFVASRGERVDGHRFIPDVAAKGAAALVVERDVETPEEITVIRVSDTRYALALMSAAYFGYPAEKLKVIGITGTKGKTTTTYMIRSILESVGYKVGLIGTIEAIVGDERIPAANTTSTGFFPMSISPYGFF